MDYWHEFKKGIFSENALFVLPILGICPSLATSGAVDTAIAMGCAATSVLVCSNVIISLIRKFVPREVRIPCFIVVIASFVTIVDLVMQAFFPTMSKLIGIFIPLIVVNCIILGRAEAFASKNSVIASFLDGLGKGIGFILALTLMGVIREGLGNGTIFGVRLLKSYEPASILIMAPGAFLVLGLLVAFFNWLRMRKRAAV